MSTPAWPSWLPRWLAYFALLLALTLVFSSQLYWSGFVTPWSNAFVQEAFYWLAWLPLAPWMFWMCRRLDAGGHHWRRYVAVLLLGAVVACVLHSLLVQAIDVLRLILAGEAVTNGLTRWLRLILRLAGIDLPVYASAVLAWHALTYYNAMRDRQLHASELESLLRQAQLHALRSQLNPHFLFNVLHSLAELVHQNPTLAERLIVRLGELLRQVLQTAALQDVPLAEELGFVKGYLEIEQLRLGARLRVHWDVEPQVLQLRVPSLLLQPLVENAIQHGIAPAAEAGELTIRAQRVEEFLHLQVRDTGLGAATGEPPRGRGIGLSNTRLRLQKLYGERHRFDLSLEAGCVVNVHIPAVAAS